MAVGDEKPQMRHRGSDAVRVTGSDMAKQTNKQKMAQKKSSGSCKPKRA